MPFIDAAATRSRQANSARVLMQLLDEDLPAAQWIVTDVYKTDNPVNGEIDGQIWHEDDSDDELEAMIKKWASRLQVTPSWDPNGRGGHLYAVGRIEGVRVRLWTALSRPPERRYPPVKHEDR